MSNPIRPSELEEMMKDISNVPEPDAEFMDSLRTRFIMEGHASAKPNQEKNMKLKQTFPRLAWALLILALVAIVLLFTAPTIVTALMRLLGYVPNVGVVEQTPDLRMLEEPITVTRDGVTVRVEQAVLSSDKTIIVYSYSLPADGSIPETATQDEWQPSLLLLDGTRLTINLGRQVNTLDCTECSMRYAMEFDPIPANVNAAFLELPSLAALPVGSAPQDWEVPLKFKAADPSAVAPVIEYQPTVAPTQVENAPAQSSTPYGVALTLDRVATLPDGYILYGNVTWTDPAIRDYGLTAMLISIKDANGADILFDYADAGAFPQPGDKQRYWAYKVNQTTLSGPLTLSFAVDAWIPTNGSFSFDPGPNPQPAQKWDINQDVLVNNDVVHVISAEYQGEGYFMFTMQSDSHIIGAQVMDLRYPPIGGGGGGGGPPEEKVPFVSGYGYQGSVPQGPLTLTITEVDVLVPGNWNLTWTP